MKVFFKLGRQTKWRVLEFTSRYTFEWWLNNIESLDPTAIILVPARRGQVAGAERQAYLGANNRRFG